MMIIKPLDEKSLKQATDLKVRAWQEELNGVFEHHLDQAEEEAFYQAWRLEGAKHQDQRLLYGAFKDERLLGAVFASFADVDDHPDAVEINGLWVEKDARHQGISLHLLHSVLTQYNQEAVILYCHTHAPSYPYYHHLGGKVMKTLTQLEGRLHVSVFVFERTTLISNLSSRLKNNPTMEVSHEPSI